MNILAIVGLVVGIVFVFSVRGRQIVLDTVIRCLFCLVCICFLNAVIADFGGNISVKINEITTCISALFGLSGIAGLYALQLFFTMT